MSNATAADVMGRLQAVFGATTDSALADAMKVNRQTLGSWRARDRIPYEECVNLATEKGLSLDWLLIGEGQMYRGAKPVGLATENQRESLVLSLLRQLPDDDQLEIQLIAQGKKRLYDLEQRLEQVTTALAGLRAA